MILPKGTFIALADGEKFELYRNTGTATAPRLEPETVPDLEATNYSAGARDKDKISRFTIGQGKDRIGKLQERAHAVAVVDWLNAQAIDHKLEKLVILADPHSLGEMRRHYHDRLRDVLIGDFDKTLTGASGPKILKALEAL